VPIHGFKSQWITQALLAGQDYFRIIKEKDARATWGSINWNFWPPAGAGLIHPHFQLMAQDRPTRYLGEMMARTKRYFRAQGTPLLADLFRQEKQSGERYIGQTGKVHWLSAFAPLGVMEIMAIWEGARDFSTFSEALLRDFAEGLVRVLNYLGSINIYSLNMAIFICLTEQDHFLPVAKIIPRIELPPLKVSEINYFERLHHESVTFYPPEQVAEEMHSFLIRK
jgi:galactose-1-phosphate uridylyltransferase